MRCRNDENTASDENARHRRISAKLKKMVDMARCPVCTKYFRDQPILYCARGHNICFACKRTFVICPTCNRNFVGPLDMNIAGNPIWRMLRCTNFSVGCGIKLPIALMLDHREMCQFNAVWCPLKDIPNLQCRWKGMLMNLRRHIRVAHMRLVRGQEMLSDFTGSGANIMLALEDNEMFVFYKEQRDDDWHGVVQRVGYSRRNYFCEIVFDSPNYVDTMKFTFVIPTFRESFHSLLNSGRCFKLKKKVMKQFLWGRSYSLSVNIYDDIRDLYH